MKKLKITLIFFALFLSQSVIAQFQPPFQDEGNFTGGLGYTWIDGQPHFSLRFTPEIAFSNIGIGLDLNLEFDSSGKLRTENFNTFEDYIRIIRYFRYGYKGDPLHFKVGALDYVSLGHGSIMYFYNNSPSFDARKNGAQFDIDFSAFGFETVWSNFLQSDIMGVRGYVRPFQFTEMRDIPIIGKAEVGASIVADFAQNVGAVEGFVDSTTNEFIATEDRGNLVVTGFDIGLPIVRTGMFNMDLYFDYAKIIDYGSGTSLGAKLKFYGMGLVDVQAKFERRWNGDQYLPSYFNPLYEIERFNYNSSTGEVTSKVKLLENALDVGKGWYGELLVTVLGTFNILGSYQRMDDYQNSGMLHLSTNILPEGMPYMARAGYDKTNINNESELFVLDEKSRLYAEVGYKPIQYIIVSLYYQWTFSPIRDANNNIIDYETQKRIEPRISFYYPFTIGG